VATIVPIARAMKEQGSVIRNSSSGRRNWVGIVTSSS
jgi:hypothetical protein